MRERERERKRRGSTGREGELIFRGGLYVRARALRNEAGNSL